MTQPIHSHLFGPGHLLNWWPMHDGSYCYLASFEGWGRRVIRRSQFSKRSEKNTSFFSNSTGSNLAPLSKKKIKT